MKTMLDKVAVAGDITQALDRRGVATVAITVIGGTESTAVKLQSCDTADGSFTDFKELIPASGATADQYKGFVVDLNGAGKFIKVVGATMATAVFGDCDYDVKEVTIKAGDIPSGADLENNKTATIDVSTYTEPVEIEPTEGKDGMKKATVTLTNIPSGGSAVAYAWRVVNARSKHPEEFNYSYLSTDISPTDRIEASTTKILAIDLLTVACSIGPIIASDDVYTRVSDTEFTVSWSEEDSLTYTRDSTQDFTLW